MANDKTLLLKDNASISKTAIISDDGYLVCLALLSNEVDKVKSKLVKSPVLTFLYRHERSAINKILGTGLGGSANRLLKLGRLRSKNKTGETAFRKYLISRDKDYKSLEFREPPAFELLWSKAESSVAVLINGEPWAFIDDETGAGYSKGILNPKIGKQWVQELFEKIFPDILSPKLAKQN